MNAFGARAWLMHAGGKIGIYRLDALDRNGLAKNLSRFPYSLKVLLESVLRQCGSFGVSEEHVVRLAAWSPGGPHQGEVPFKPARIIAPDFTGATMLVDLAAMRAAVVRLGKDPRALNPKIPVEIVVDHSIQVDAWGSSEAMATNAAMEMKRNRERFELFRSGQNAVKNLRVIPPGVGIVHQVNLELLARGIMRG